MFTERLTTTPLTSAAANDFYENVQDARNDFYDSTLLSTIRAVIWPKMSELDALYVSTSLVDTGTRIRTTIGNYPANDGDFHDYIDVILINGISSEQSYANSVSAMNEWACTKFGWSKLTKVRAFFKKVMDIECYINPRWKAVKVFIKNCDLRKYHLFQSAIFAFFPWYMEDVKELSDIDRRLVESMNSRTHEDYMKLMAEIAASKKFEYEAMRRALSGFETRSLENAKSSIVDLIEQTVRDIIEYESSIRRLYDKKRDYDIKLLGYNTAINEQEKSEPELLDYFVRNKNIKFIENYGESITFVAKGYLDLYDEDIAESVINNRHSYVFGRNRTMNDDDVEIIMRAIFIDKKMRIKSCAAYKLSMSYVDGISGYNYGPEYSGYFPNPHIDNYACIGDYRRVIMECAQTGDTIGAIEQCVASNNSLNFADSIVMGKFMNCLVADNRGRCIELPDGTCMNFKEALEYLKGEANE